MRFKSLRLLGAACLTAVMLVNAAVVDTAAAKTVRTPKAQVLTAKRAPAFLRHARAGDIHRLSPRQRAIVKRLVRNAARNNPLSKNARAATYYYVGLSFNVLDDFWMVDQWYYNSASGGYNGYYQTCDSRFCYWSHTYQVYLNGFTYGLYTY